ncbi:hypothetical protein [Halosolutus gelatinilyticus]|uniref:hypothetical protein n=1 Tax=Halosolutus gelatinilyticus TaxID=2931975 RepID=UPI001FF2678B|nr:hypothetical protein [Halosolutus gelatinilyticus]
MSNDEPRTPTPPDDAQAPIDDYRSRLATIDAHASAVLDAIEGDETIEPGDRRTATRHLREVRAELERAAWQLCEGEWHTRPETEPHGTVSVVRGPMGALVDAARRRAADQGVATIDDERAGDETPD